MDWFSPPAAIMADALEAVRILGSAPASRRICIISMSLADAARRNAVPPAASRRPPANDGCGFVMRRFTFAPWASRAFTSRSFAWRSGMPAIGPSQPAAEVGVQLSHLLDAQL